MEYKGKLYGKVHKLYFPLEATTDDWDALEKRIAELEAENKALRQQPIIKSTCPKCRGNGVVNEPNKPEKHECEFCDGTGQTVL